MESFDNAEEIGGFEEIFGETETKIVDLPDFDFDKFRKESLKNVLIKVQFSKLFYVAWSSLYIVSRLCTSRKKRFFVGTTVVIFVGSRKLVQQKKGLFYT